MAGNLLLAACLVSAGCVGGALSARCIAGSDLRSGRKQQRNLRCGGRWSALVLEWRTLNVTRTRSLFEKPKPSNAQQIVQPGFASFSPDGQWLFIIPPTLASVANAEAAAQGSPQQGVAVGVPSPATTRHAKFRSGDGRCRNRTYESAGEDWKFSGFEVPA